MIQLSKINKSQQESSDYVFCYNEDSPKSLIMLQKSDKILDLLLAHQEVSQQTMYIWINQNPDSQFYIQVQKMQKELQIEFSKCQSLQLLKKDILQNRIIQPVIIVCHPSMEPQLVGLNQVQYVIFYPLFEYDEIQYQSYQMYYYQNLYIVQNMLRAKIKRTKHVYYKQFPNFLFLNNQASTSNAMIRSILAMVNCENDSKTQNLVIMQLQKLIKKLEQKHGYDTFVTENFIKELQQGEMSSKRSLYWYIIQSTVYKLVNNLLRSTQQPCVLFYIQPYFKILFNTISSLHKTQKYKRKFICYRGGRITRYQFQKFQENVGKIVQNLGFLSTNFDKQMAGNFLINVFFKIFVDQQHLDQSLSQGYANISQSSNYQQSEIIFNPSNFFKILSIKKTYVSQNQVLQVQLEFKDFLQKSDPKIILGQKQRLDNLYSNKQNKVNDQIKFQGNAFGIKQEYKRSDLIYWQKVEQICKVNFKNICKKQEQNIQTYELIKQLQNANYCYIQKYRELKETYGQALQYIGLYYQTKGEYKNALKYYQILNKIFNHNDIRFINALMRKTKIYKNEVERNI